MECIQAGLHSPVLPPAPPHALGCLLPPQALEAARREVLELRGGRLEAEATHNKERLAQAGLLVRGSGSQSDRGHDFREGSSWQD